jgi:hypothetical protein
MKFWEQPFTYSPFTVTRVSDVMWKLEYVHIIRSIIQYNFGGCSVHITYGGDLRGMPQMAWYN